MRPFLPKLDVPFQALFNEPERKNLLMALLNAILTPCGHPTIVDVELINPGINALKKGDKRPKFDVRARSSDNTIYHVEMQLQHETGLYKRFFFYNCKTIASQIQAGGEYKQLKPVISIIVNDFPEMHQLGEHYHLMKMPWIMEPKERKPLYEVNEGLEVHYLQLRQLPHFKPENMLQYSPAELWGFFLSLESEADRGRLLDMGKAYQQALEAWNTLSQDQQLREKQWQLEAAEADYLISMSEAKKEGIEIGQEKGIEIGREEGIEIGREEGIEIGQEEGIEIGQDNSRKELITNM